LLYPKPDPGHANIRIEFPGFEFWMDDFGARKSHEMRSALNLALQDYQKVRENYLKDVRDLLQRLRHWVTARAVLDEIRTRHHCVRINPLQAAGRR
jgi:hypothetical protein